MNKQEALEKIQELEQYIEDLEEDMLGPRDLKENHTGLHKLFKALNSGISAYESAPYNGWYYCVRMNDEGTTLTIDLYNDTSKKDKFIHEFVKVMNNE